jgi:transposase-like protein
LKATNDSYRVDETYIKIKKRWYYLYRAVDSTGATLDFMLSPTRDAEAAERFFRQVLQAAHTLTPRVITVDKNAAYPPAFESLQQEKLLPETCQLRQCKYLNNIVEQDQRPLDDPQWEVRAASADDRPAASERLHCSGVQVTMPCKRQLGDHDD